MGSRLLSGNYAIQRSCSGSISRPLLSNGAPSRAHSILLMKAWEYYKKTTTRVVNGEGAFFLLKGYEYEHYSQSLNSQAARRVIPVSWVSHVLPLLQGFYRSTPQAMSSKTFLRPFSTSLRFFRAFSLAQIPILIKGVRSGVQYGAANTGQRWCGLNAIPAELSQRIRLRIQPAVVAMVFRRRIEDRRVIRQGLSTTSAE